MPPVQPHTSRTILHVDMDAFFASVEQRDNPALRGKPVLVAGDGPRGVVAAASYEARAFGCHSAQPTAIAKRRCPNATIVSGSYSTYKAVSKQVFEILERFSPAIQPISIDEAFLDVTGSTHLFGPGESIAKQIRALVLTETGLTCSVGVAPNKFLAKLASDLNKPDGISVIPPDQIRQILDPMPVTKLWGVGPSAERTLGKLGIRTIADLRKMPVDTLIARMGDQGRHLHQLAQGIDDRPVRIDREAKSISHEHTFSTDLEDPDEVRAILARQAQDVATRLRKHLRYAKTITIKVRFGEFETITRSTTLDAQTDETRVIHDAARALFDTWARAYRPVRLIGIGVSQLTDAPAEPGLFDQTDHTAANKSRAVDRVSDAIADRFGKDAIARASAIRAKPRHGAHGPGSDTPTNEGHTP
jgi:DNA polymerase-4